MKRTKTIMVEESSFAHAQYTALNKPKVFIKLRPGPKPSSIYNSDIKRGSKVGLRLKKVRFESISRFIAFM